MSPRALNFHFTLRNADGHLLDTSRGNPPVVCVEGTGQVIEGLERALREMTAGERRQVAVPAALGYGERDEGLVQKIPRRRLPVEELKAGDRFQTGPDRHAPVVTVLAVEGDEVLLDANHPLAGQVLYFDVELVSVRPATREELQAAPESS